MDADETGVADLEGSSMLSARSQRSIPVFQSLSGGNLQPSSHKTIDYKLCKSFLLLMRFPLHALMSAGFVPSVGSLLMFTVLRIALYTYFLSSFCAFLWVRQRSVSWFWLSCPSCNPSTKSPSPHNAQWALPAFWSSFG